MRTLASPMPFRNRFRTGAWPRLAAIALHVAVLALFLAVIRSGDRAARRVPVALAPAPPRIAAEAGPVPAIPVPAVRALPVRRLRAPVEEGVPPVPRPVPERPAVALRAPPGAAGVVRAYREGAAPPDSAALSEEGLRRAALAEATRRWNLAFQGIIPEARQEMFLKALENSPFPRR